METKRKAGRPRDPNSKRSTGRAYARPRLVFHVTPELLALFERYLESPPRGPAVTASAVLRRALLELLEREGHWPPKGT